MPSIINATTSTGLVSSADNSGSLQLATNNGTTAVTIDTSQNVGIGTASPATKLHVVGNSAAIQASESGGASVRMAAGGSTGYSGTYSNHPLAFLTDSTERMRIPSGGGLLVGSTSDNLSANGFRITSATGQFGGITMTGDTGDGPQWQMINLTAAATVPNGFRWLSFRIGSGASEIGKVEKASSTSVAFTTTSDYRLKENVEPLTNALERVAALKPVKWKWKNQNDGGEGFIAHELSEICPLAVTGKKDAYEKDGVTPRYQGVDTSFLVATLTAAIQELKAELDATKAEVAALKGA